MSTIAVQPLPWHIHTYDILMLPVMFVLRGFMVDSLQATHLWHVQPVDLQVIDQALVIAGENTDHSLFDGHFSFLFHAPVFGGWKDFSVYEADEVSTPFHIGWISKNLRTGAVES